MSAGEKGGAFVYFMRTAHSLVTGAFNVSTVSPGRTLREAVAESLLQVPGAPNALLAKLIERMGFSAVYLSGAAAEKGDTADAEKRLRNVVEHGPNNYASMARVSLAQVLATEGKMPEAEKVLRDAVAHPSAMVSKESAQLALAQLLAKSNPTEAKKIVEPLRMLPSRTAITRAAIGLDGELSGPSTAPSMLPITTIPVK